jgi:soluble lytic murein transglycosylase-like protein
MQDLETIEQSRRLRRRYYIWLHALAGVACLMVVGQYRHMDRLHQRLAVQGDVQAQLRAEQQRIGEFHAEIALLKRHVIRYKIIDYIRIVAPRRPARRIADAILAAAEAHQVDPALIVGVVKTESYFDPRARSDTDARGLAQIVRSTAREIGLDWHRAYDIEANVYYGAYYLRQLLNANDDDVPRSLRRYNGNDDPHYPAKVLAVHERLTRQR